MATYKNRKEAIEKHITRCEDQKKDQKEKDAKQKSRKTLGVRKQDES